VSDEHASCADSQLLGPGVTRRTLLGAAAALGLGTAFASSLSDRAVAAVSDAPVAVVSAAALYVDFDAKVAKVFGVAKAFSAVVSGDGTVRPGLTNRFAPILPFTGASVAANRLPSGLAWHSEKIPKKLLVATSDKISYRGTTISAAPGFFGGVRTVSDVVAPGQSVLLSFKSDISNVSGNANVSIRVFLLRMNDQKSTLGVRAYNAQETPNVPNIVRLTAPSGGSGGYRLVFTAEAGSLAINQQATIDISEIVLVTVPTSLPTIGARYAAPTYFRDSVSSATAVFSPQAPAGEYHVLFRTDEFGWGAETLTIGGTSSTVELKRLLGSAVNMRIREFYLIAKSKWQKGWLDKVSPNTSWIPARFMNVDNSRSLSRPESPNRLSRMTGMPAALSAISTEGNGNVPSLAAPAATWAVSFNPNRLSHHAFSADKDKYIGDTSDNGAVRSELLPGESVPFETDVWISFWTRALTTLSDPMYDRSAVMFQYRYVKNATGDSSSLSPDLAFEQFTNNRFRLRYRTDGGTPVLSGSTTPAGITTVESAPIDYKVGQWYSVVVRARFSKTGGGRIGLWVDGQTLIDQDAAVGYNRNVGPSLHYGSYKFSDYPSRIEFQHMEHGTRNLSRRIASPLAL
jgi:hypothetical protein